MRRRILIIEDEEGLARVLGDNLVFEGYDVQHLRGGGHGLAQALAWHPDVVILDLTLPDVDGFDLCREIAGRAVAPVIILSARSQDVDKIRGLELGADDYVTKPFSIGELLARIRVVLRRADGERPGGGTVRFSDVSVDLDRSIVERGGSRLPFTQKEMELLRFLLTRPGRVFSRDELLHMVWGYKEAPLTRTVDTHVARLRHKLEIDPHNPRHIQTVYGTGYVFMP